MFRVVCLLGYTEKDFWRMTTRKAVALFEQYCLWHGRMKKKEDVSIAQFFGV